jgi:NTP pyrophosphatase (non-canonical NTP hydrolase)
MGILQQEATQRAEQMFGCGDAHERPADLLADIMQYCLVEGIDWADELETACQYVAEENMRDTDNEELL